jgi:hypothetical protein
MLKKFLVGTGALLAIAVLFATIFGYGANRAVAEAEIKADSLDVQSVVSDGGFSVEVVVDGMAATEYAARGRRYIEALENAEYEVRVHNPTASRVAVALSVDGLNTIDARHTSAWDAHKWVIEPYGTIHVRGWQMSSDSARRFYFTTERDSYAAKLGQAANVGVIAAVFFRERRPPVTVMPVTPRPYDKDDRQSGAPANAPNESSARGDATRSEQKERTRAYPPPDDESAATGIGRSVANSVQWIKMDLEPRPAGEITIRYEYRAALVRLGIIPRDYPRPGVLDRRERAQGFEPKYCPQP